VETLSAPIPTETQNFKLLVANHKPHDTRQAHTKRNHTIADHTYNIERLITHPPLTPPTAKNESFEQTKKKKHSQLISLSFYQLFELTDMIVACTMAKECQK
jgi:hypothetical protein